MEKFDQTKYENAYKKANYWKPSVLFAKADEQRIRAAAASAGQSVGEFIKNAVLDKVGTGNKLKYRVYDASTGETISEKEIAKAPYELTQFDVLKAALAVQTDFATVEINGKEYNIYDVSAELMPEDK